MNNTDWANLTISQNLSTSTTYIILFSLLMCSHVNVSQMDKMRRLEGKCLYPSLPLALVTVSLIQCDNEYFIFEIKSKIWELIYY